MAKEKKPGHKVQITKGKNYREYFYNRYIEILKNII